jgi:hypothetical protein
MLSEQKKRKHRPADTKEESFARMRELQLKVLKGPYESVINTRRLI